MTPQWRRFKREQRRAQERAARPRFNFVVACLQFNRKTMQHRFTGQVRDVQVVVHANQGTDVTFWMGDDRRRFAYRTPKKAWHWLRNAEVVGNWS